MLSERYESTKDNRRTWLHVPSGTLWSTSSDTNRLKYKKRLLRRCIHHFKSDLINNMDHMRITGTETSSVILSQTKWFKKLKSDTPRCQNKLKPTRDYVMNPQNYNFNQASLRFESIKIFHHYTIPFSLSLFWHLGVSRFYFLNHFVWLRITDEGSVPEIRI